VRFTYPPTLETGDVLSRVHVESFRANDEYFNGLANCWRTVNRGAERNFIGDELSINIFEGRHILRSDAKTLQYYLYVNGNATTQHTVTLYYDGVQVGTVSSSSGVQTSDSTYDLSAKSPGMYRVHAVLTRANNSYNLTGGLRPPFTRYTGARSYTTPATITDGGISAAWHFTRWRDNDLYFRDVTPINSGFSGLEAQYIGSGLNRDLFHGWARFHPDHYSIRYRVYLSTNADGNKIRLYYDYGGGNQETHDITATGWSTGTWTLSSPGNFTKGNFYHVAARMIRSGTTQATGDVTYLMSMPTQADASYNVMDEFAAEQYVYGSTAGQDSRLALLSSNDSAIRDRLVWGATTPSRMDFAFRRPEIARLGGTDYGVVAIMRRYDLLYFRTHNVDITWGEDSQRLENYSDPGNPYYTIDLNALGIPRGMIYYLEGEVVDYAAEIPEV
jgi:hypothetical protein